MSRKPPECITIANGTARLAVVPTSGSGIARYWTEAGARQIDWLRPTTPEALAERDPTGLACFPLVPYSNRIRNGCFRFAGELIAMPRSETREAHAEHGHGWVSPWTVVARSADRLTTEYRHAADSWPFTYSARQIFQLAETALHVRIELRNDDRRPMPCGIGLHPYFPRDPDSRLFAEVEGMWRNDPDTLPVEHISPPAPQNPARGLAIDRVELDNVFTEWSRLAMMEWPSRNQRLEMVATPPLAFLVIYTPAGEPYFCAEPVSNCTDAFNLAAAGITDTGMIVLAPGQTISGEVTFRTHIDGVPQLGKPTEDR
jgi:aldose 1-epimerase